MRTGSPATGAVAPTSDFDGGYSVRPADTSIRARVGPSPRAVNPDAKLRIEAVERQRRQEAMRRKSALENNHSNETATEGFASTCSVLVVGLFALTFVFQNFVIPSSSMASTLLVGDHVVVERETLAPATKWATFMHYRDVHRGDVVVFYKPTEERNGDAIFLVKRVIGIPGDHIHLRSGIV